MLRKMSVTNNDLVNAQKMNIDLLDTNHLIQGPIVKVDRLFVRLSGKPENSSSRFFLDNKHSPGASINENYNSSVSAKKILALNGFVICILDYWSNSDGGI